MEALLRPEGFELSNFDGDCIKGGSKVQSSDATSHGLTAYNGAPNKQNSKIERLQYWKACKHTILAPKLIKNKFPQIKVKFY